MIENIFETNALELISGWFTLGNRFGITQVIVYVYNCYYQLGKYLFRGSSKFDNQSQNYCSGLMSVPRFLTLNQVALHEVIISVNAKNCAKNDAC